MMPVLLPKRVSPHFDPLLSMPDEIYGSEPENPQWQWVYELSDDVARRRGEEAHLPWNSPLRTLPLVNPVANYVQLDRVSGSLLVRDSVGIDALRSPWQQASVLRPSPSDSMVASTRVVARFG